MPQLIERETTSPDVVELLDEYFEQRAAVFTGGTYVVNRPDAASFVPPAGIFLVVIDGDRPVGCGGIRRLTPTRFEVKHLYLRPETRGRGWGRMLLGELERHAIELGATEMVLDTNATQAAAAGLYRSQGYADVEPYNENPNATHWFRRQLS